MFLEKSTWSARIVDRKPTSLVFSRKEPRLFSEVIEVDNIFDRNEFRTNVSLSPVPGQVARGIDVKESIAEQTSNGLQKSVQDGPSEQVSVLAEQCWMFWKPNMQSKQLGPRSTPAYVDHLRWLRLMIGRREGK